MKKIKDKLKRIRKNNLFYFTLGLIVAGTASVAASAVFPSNGVTYDNKESGLSATNVQAAIDELYTSCIPSLADDFMREVVTSGDGLYKDEHEEGRYIYKGNNPNNYITFNDENAGWRVISVENDGTIKIVKIDSIGNEYWNSTDSTNWESASLNKYLNGTYYNRLTSTAQSQIVEHDFSVGSVYEDSSNLANQINEENTEKWNGKVGLISTSEYIRANTNTAQCGTVELNNNNGCINWMALPNTNSNWWTINGTRYNSTYAYFYNYGRLTGSIYGHNVNVSRFGVKPAVYLSSSLKIISGSGTQNSPFQIG